MFRGRNVRAHFSASSGQSLRKRERYGYAMQEIKITGQAVVLRQMNRSDTDNIVKWRNNERVRKNFIYREVFTPAGHEKWIDTMVETGKVVQLIICEKADMRPVGSVYFRDIDRVKKEAEYGINWCFGHLWTMGRQ